LKAATFVFSSFQLSGLKVLWAPQGVRVKTSKTDLIPAEKNVKIDKPALNKTDVALLRKVRNEQIQSTNLMFIHNRIWAQKIKRSVRCVQLAMAKLVTAGLVQRDPRNKQDPFSEVKTKIANQEKVYEILKSSKVQELTPVKRRRSVPEKKDPPKDRYPFRYLQDNSGRVSLEDVENACKKGISYWNWLSRAATSVKLDIPITIRAQKRRMSDGKRGGIVPQLIRNENFSSKRIPEPSVFLLYLAEGKMEATYQAKNEENPLLLIDDVRIEMIDLLPDAAFLLETSNNNFQATVVAPRNLTARERRNVQAHLISLVEGDPAANTRSQLRRLPGSVNNKALLDKAFITRVFREPEKLTLSTDELEQMLLAGELLMGSNKRCIKEYAPAGDVGTASSIIRRGSNPSDSSPSGQDFGLAIELLLSKTPIQKIIEIIARRAAERNKYGSAGSPEQYRRYAETTVANARAHLRR
jgi:hypothetical protein